MPAASDTTEARLAALEMQRVKDHFVINALGDMIMGVQGEVRQQSTALQALTQTGLELRQHVSVVRSELAAGVNGASDAAQSAAMTQMAVAVEAKFAQLDALTNELTSCIQTLGMREQMVEQVDQLGRERARLAVQTEDALCEAAALADRRPRPGVPPVGGRRLLEREEAGDLGSGWGRAWGWG